MVKQNLRDKMCENGFENSIVYDCPSFDNSIIGYDMVTGNEYNKDEVDFKIEDKYKQFVEYYY